MLTATLNMLTYNYIIHASDYHNYGALKYGSPFLLLKASNNCFSYRKTFQNGVDFLSKIGDAFCLRERLWSSGTAQDSGTLDREFEPR